MPRLLLAALVALGLAGAPAVRAAPLAVTVLDAAGRPVKAARVAVAPGALGWEALDALVDAAGAGALTDGAGRAALKVEPGWATVVALAPGPPEVGAAVALHVRRAGSEVRLVLEPGLGLTGTVLDPEGHPVAGVAVRALPDVDPLGPEPRGLGAAASDAAGAFALPGADARGYRLLARGSGHAGPLGLGAVSGGARGLRVTVGRGRLLRGAVADEEGTPLPGAEVRGPDGALLARTGEGGQFEAAVPPGPVELAFSHPRELPLTRRVEAGERAVEVALAAGARVRVLALDEGGAPVPGAALTVRAGGREVGCRTDEAGRCELAGLPHGEGALSAQAAGARAPPVTFLRLGPGKPQELELRLPRQRSRLTVHVVDARGQELARPAVIFPGAPGLKQAVDGRRTPLLPWHLAAARTPLEDLAPDRYTVLALDEAGRQCAVTVMTLQGGEEKEITLRLGDGSCR